MTTYNTTKHLNLPQIDREINDYWEKNNVFEKSISSREGQPTFTFYEGPPSVNGQPGIHHVMARAIKDTFCRYQTLKGKQVHRKAGWDTHGLPIELQVEKELGITKDDIGKTISVEAYNQKCRQAAMRYIDVWNDITHRMGYWVDMKHPYITYENTYIETLWYLLKQFYDKKLLYKGYTIQPYSPAAGTGLSTHELNQPGSYRPVKDTSATVQFEIIRNSQSEFLWDNAPANAEIFFLAWTTTPWTLPSNTALALGANIQYTQVNTYNPYTYRPVSLILAQNRLNAYFKPENAQLNLADYTAGDKAIPYQIAATYTGSQLDNIRYVQLLPYSQPTDGDAFRTILGDFVTTADGTGIVHIAPSFGSDDMRVARKYGIGSLTLVDKQGKFIPEVTDFAGRYVKDYQNQGDNYQNPDIDIAVKLKNENRAFKIEKYEHNYPHCWRTDKPILYYPLDSWFIRSSAYREQMSALNKTIYWKPEATGSGRFGNWLENLQDWNLSRSRYWGCPLPIWRTQTENPDIEPEEICIGSVAELYEQIEKAIAANVMTQNPLTQWKNGTPLNEACDLHRPFIDDIVLISPSGKPMYRESDLIDVWFDSGAVPYAQWHYPFGKKNLDGLFPADFIAEGVDQTRGWFYTLHAIATMLFDSVAYKTVISNGLVLDENGNKMSKRLGNAVDPFTAINLYGADAVRWYMIGNSDPWENLKFSWTKEKDENGNIIREYSTGIEEVRNKFFGTLHNTYAFFALYANLDGFQYSEPEIPLANRPEIDRWIISMLHSLVKQVDAYYADYDATPAARLIHTFVNDHLSNWYVRLCRRRFWKGEYEHDKISAYQTLYQCLETVSQLMSPIAPYYSDYLFNSLNQVSKRQAADSVHLSQFPIASPAAIDPALEERMQMAQTLSSLVLSLRKKVKIKVRQPLRKILIPVLDPQEKIQLQLVENLILAETNVKAVEYVNDTSGLVTKSVKPDFKSLGKKMGKHINLLKDALAQMSQEDIAVFEKKGSWLFTFENTAYEVLLNEVLIQTEDLEGWLVNSLDGLTVALDTAIDPQLEAEGIARELVNRLQRLRKENDFNVTDHIRVTILYNEGLENALKLYRDYICSETLISQLQVVDHLHEDIPTFQLDLEDINVQLQIALE